MPRAHDNHDHPGDPAIVDRRSGLDRRDDPSASPNAVDLDRRRGPGRRLTDFTKAAEEGEHTAEQFLFVKAIDAFKKANGKTFPTWTDVLEVVRLLGYRKTQPHAIADLDAQDFTEKPDAPHRMRTYPHETDEDRKAA
ncbi:MAG: hypothetical protein Tsb0013_21360 [Phycisphaerales bacterium]